jgi:hypothetical protein
MKGLKMATVITTLKGGFRHFQCDDEEVCLRLSFLIKDAGYGFKMSNNWVKKHTEFKIIAAEKDPMEDPKVIKGAKALRINLQEAKGKKASASEVIRNLEQRIARLENQRTAGFHDYDEDYAYDSSDSYRQPFKDDYFDQAPKYGYAVMSTITARNDKRVLNQAGKRLGCMITKVKEAKEIHMVCNGSKVQLKVRYPDDNSFQLFVNGKKVGKAWAYWGDIDSHSGGSDRDLQNRYVEFLKENILPHC